jgi:hypothetical protein
MDNKKPYHHYYEKNPTDLLYSFLSEVSNLAQRRNGSSSVPEDIANNLKD